jgi:hypothetical protein
MRARWRGPASRRRVLTQGLAGALGLGLGLAGGRAAGAQEELVTVSGGGVNVKQMPSPDGSAEVRLRESFSFDPHYAQCIIEDNPADFAMDTFAMGTVVVEAHTFFMAMYATDLSLVSIRDGGGGTRVAKLTGALSCSTEAGTASGTVGSRTATEPAFYEIEAVDGGHGGGAAGDRFAFTVFFDPDQAPVNHAIFGPKPTFTGEMVAGEVTIAVPAVLPLLPAETPSEGTPAA